MITPHTPKLLEKNFTFFFIQHKNDWKELKCWRQKNLKSDFYKNKKITKIDDIYVNKILVSKEEPYGAKKSFKYFTGYDDNDVIRPLCMKLPQMIGYVRKFEGNTTMSFKISDSKLLKKYNQTWKTVGKLLKIKFNSEPEKYIKKQIHKNKNKNTWW